MNESEITDGISLGEYVAHIGEKFGSDQPLVKEYKHLVDSIRGLAAENKELKKEVAKKERCRKNLAEQRARLFIKVKDYKKVITFLSREI